MKNSPPKVVVVVGSIGKTSTKYAITRVLSPTFKVNADIGDANAGDKLKIAFFGITFKETAEELGLFEYLYMIGVYIFIKLRKHFYPYDVLVLEVSETEAVHRKSQLIEFLKLIHPELCVVTGISGAHLGKMGDRRTIRTALQLVAEQCDRLIFNDDFKELDYLKKNSRFLTTYNQRLVSGIHTQLASHSNSSIAAALYVAGYFGIEQPVAAKRLASIHALPGRMQELRGKHGELIIDDSFNASKEAAIAGLQDLKKRSGYRVAIMGGINELGKHSAAEHRDVAAAVAQCADMAVLVGRIPKRYMAPVIRSKKTVVHCFNNAQAAGRFLQSQNRSDWTIYAKGSQDGIYIEESIKPLLARRHWKNLPRQTRYWRRTKKQFFIAHDTSSATAHNQ